MEAITEQMWDDAIKQCDAQGVHLFELLEGSDLSFPKVFALIKELAADYRGETV